MEFKPLKRCLQSTDPFFQTGDKACQLPYTCEQKHAALDVTEELHKTLVAFPCSEPSCTSTFDNVDAFEMHYNLKHKNTCISCKKSLPSQHLLGIHIQEQHDMFFQAQVEKNAENMFKCLVEGCVNTFSNPDTRRDHLIKHHKYPTNFRFYQTSKPRINGRKDEMQHDGSQQKRFPSKICFGQGSVKSFQWQNKTKLKSGPRKQKPSETHVNIEDVNMKDLEDALK